MIPLALPPTTPMHMPRISCSALSLTFLRDLLTGTSIESSAAPTSSNVGLSSTAGMSSGLVAAAGRAGGREGPGGRAGSGSSAPSSGCCCAARRPWRTTARSRARSSILLPSVGWPSADSSGTSSAGCSASKESDDALSALS